MKTYSVKQVAEMLGTNQETVRRWIRDHKLEAALVSRKDGRIITDDELQRFLKAKPKYLLRYSASLVGGVAAAPVIGIPLLLSSLLGSKILGYLDDKKQADFRIHSEAIEQYLVSAIAQQKESLRQKKATLKQIEQDIQESEERLEQLQYLMAHKELFKESTNVKEER